MSLDFENLMLVRVKKQGHFYRLMDEPEYAEEYFNSFDYSQLNAKKLNSLKNKITKFERKRRNITNLQDWANINGPKILANDLYFRKSAANSEWLDARDELDLFESNLVYLIINSKFTLDDVKEAGFDVDYSLNLLERYKAKAEKPYTEYYYDTETGRSYVTTDKGSIYPLDTTPEEVFDEVYVKSKK